MADHYAQRIVTLPNLPAVSDERVGDVVFLLGANAGLYRARSQNDFVKLDNSEIVNIKDFGARGTGTVDDGPAIQRAINEAPAGATVRIPVCSAFYAITAYLSLKSDLAIEFETSARIRQLSDALDPITPIFRFGNVSNLKIKGGILEGVNASGLGVVYPANTRGLIDYIGTTNPHNVVIDGTEVRYSYDAGIQIAGLLSTGIRLLNVHVHRCANFGIAAPSGEIEIVGCNVHDNQYAGLDAGGAWAFGELTVVGGRYWQNGGYNGGGLQDFGAWAGILLLNSRRVTIVGAKVYNNGCHGISVLASDFLAGPQDIVLDANEVFGHLVTANPTQTPSGIKIAGGRNIALGSNNCHDNYDNYLFQPVDADLGYVGIRNLSVTGNVSANASNRGYRANRPTSVKTGDAPTGEVIFGMNFVGNVSRNDDVPYDMDIYGASRLGPTIVAKTETLGAELVPNNSFEIGNPPVDWNDNGTTITRVVDARPGSAGIHAADVELVNPGGSAWCSVFGLLEGRLYKVEVWVKRITDSDSRPRITIERAGGGPWEFTSWWDSPAELPVDTWRQHVGYFVAGANANYTVLLRGGRNVGDHYRIDDVSIRPVTNDAVGMPIFADNATAITGGLTVGEFYRTGADPDLVCIVH